MSALRGVELWGETAGCLNSSSEVGEVEEVVQMKGAFLMEELKLKLKEAKGKFMKRKECMESKVLKLNLGKTKAMISGAGEDPVVNSGR